MKHDNNIKEYLQIKFEEYGIEKKVWEFSDADLFYFAVLFKEGMDLGSLTKGVFVIAKDIVEKDGFKAYKFKNIMKKLNELETGEVNLADFKDGKELARYITKGE